MPTSFDAQLAQWATQLGLPLSVLCALAGVFLGVLIGRASRGKSASSAGAQDPRHLHSARAPGAAPLGSSGTALDLDPALQAQLRDLLSRDQKLEAIKQLRAASGLGLAEAKAVVEAIARGGQ